MPRRSGRQRQPHRRTWPRTLPSTAVLATAGVCFAPCALAGPASEVKQYIEHIWPMTLLSAPLTRASQKQGEDEVMEARPLDKELAKIGKKGFDRYLREILPLELKADKKLAKEMATGDASIMNLAFLRWQKRSYSLARHIPVEELNYDGSPIPHLPGVPYDWDDLWKSKAERTFRKHVSTLVRDFTIAVRQTPSVRKGRYRQFIWVEVFRQGEFSWPHTHTGAICAGTYFARYRARSNASQSLMFDDPRGAMPPFGRRERHAPNQGEVLLWPAWASHSVAPNPGNTTQVFINFLVWPEGGAPDWDWEDDPSGDVRLHKRTTIRVRKQAESAQGRPAKGPTHTDEL